MDGKTDREVRSRGFSLLEVLITTLVLSLGLLGLAALQIAGVRDTQSAYLKSQVVNRSHQIVDLMRANRDAARAGVYDDAFEQRVDSYCGIGGPGTVRSDLCAWERALTATLPDGAGSVEVDGRTATVCIRWAEPRRAFDVGTDECGTAAGGDPGKRRFFKLQTVL